MPELDRRPPLDSPVSVEQIWADVHGRDLEEADTRTILCD